MLPLPKEPTRGDDVLEWARQTQRVLRSLRPQAGAGIRLAEGLNNFTISADPAKGGGAKEIHPFHVYSRATETGFEYGVKFESSLYSGLNPTAKRTITGLLSSDQSSGWFDLATGGYIWLEVTDSAAHINNSDDDEFDLTKNAWVDGGYCEDNGAPETPAWQTSRKLIAYTVADPGGKPILHQVMHHDQVLRNVCIDGRPAIYPFDHSGGYPL